MKDELIIAHDISQEYWYITRNPCPCGGSFQKQEQALGERNGISIDSISTRCDKCGNAREFLFDISAFHGNYDEKARFRELYNSLELTDNEIDKRIRSKLNRLDTPPVVKAVMTIMELGKSGDDLALDWLEGAINQARKNEP